MSAWLALLVGLALGSFLNVVITRLPRGEVLGASRSRCPQCRAPLPWRDNVPLLSYLWLKGRCRFCQAPISWRYPLVELVGGLLALGLWLRFPGSLLLLAYGPLAAALLTLSVIDLEQGLLPDVITLPGIALGLSLSLVLPHLTLLASAGGALLGGGVFFLIAWIYEKAAGKQGMGGGDVKLMAMIGAFLGINAVPVVIFISAALGALTGLAWTSLRGQWRQGQWRTAAIPYGPFLAAAAIIYLLVGLDWVLLAGG